MLPISSPHAHLPLATSAAWLVWYVAFGVALPSCHFCRLSNGPSDHRSTWQLYIYFVALLHRFPRFTKQKQNITTHVLRSTHLVKQNPGQYVYI